MGKTLGLLDCFPAEVFVHKTGRINLLLLRVIVHTQDGKRGYSEVKRHSETEFRDCDKA
jgi:hypothetical protein